MDFMNHNAQPQAAPSAPQAPSAHTPASSPKPKRMRRLREYDSDKFWRIATIVLLFCMTILGIAIIGIIAIGGSDENKLINKKDYQAVFLTNGQVYFGNIAGISKDFVQLDNIYYLTQNTTTDKNGNTTTDGNYTLVKLGCQQIHDPLDQMVINRDQVTFWENLNNAGKVVTSIHDFQKNNPNGPDCSQVSNQTQASSNTGTQGGSTNNTANQPTNNNTTGNKQ